MPPKREATHSDRAAGLLKRLRATSARPETAARMHASPADDVALPLPRLIHALHTIGGVSVVDAMAIVRALAHAKRNTRGQLRRISAPELEEIGAQCTGTTRDRVVQVLHTLGASDDAAGLSEAEREGRQNKLREDVKLRREWGNARSVPGALEDEGSLDFHAVVDADALRGRHVVVNRSPVLTAWCVVVLQSLGFSTHEALSIAQCYVSTTAEARARSLGRQQQRDAHVVSANQPHVDFMGVKIPVICLKNGRYRGMHSGEVVPPTRAFDYLRRSMFQMLPQVMGALTLLANSYVDASGNAEALHAAAYELYTEFRPETHGEWGKRGTLYLDVILGLRREAPTHPRDDKSAPQTHDAPPAPEASTDAPSADPSATARDACRPRPERPTPAT